MGMPSLATAKTHLADFSVLRECRYKYYGVPVPGYEHGIPKNVLPTGTKLQFIRHASIATPGQPENDDEEYEVVTKKKKEASPEECDQAVLELSTAKEKVKSQLQECQRGAETVLHRVWSTLLGIGPALRAIPSMSRFELGVHGDFRWLVLPLQMVI